MARNITQAQIISIHAPRTGSDDTVLIDNPKQRLFQSTPPARGATVPDKRGSAAKAISIHAPRTGSDCEIHNYQSVNSAMFGMMHKHFEQVKPAQQKYTIKNGKFQSPFGANLAGFLCSLHLRVYTIIGASGSYAFLAPMCSIFDA